MQKVKVITNDLVHVFEEELERFIQKDNKTVHQINYQTVYDRYRTIHSALIIYTEKEEGEKNENS